MSYALMEYAAWLIEAREQIIFENWVADNFLKSSFMRSRSTALISPTPAKPHMDDARDGDWHRELVRFRGELNRRR